MFLTKKHLSRRTLLQGAGASIALPLLDAMIPAHTAMANTAAAPRARLGFVYFPHGAVRQFWTPKKTGRDFDFSVVLKPLEPLRDYVTVVSGLRNKGAENAGAPHATTELSWLSSVGRPGRTATGQHGISADQVAARHIGQATPMPSLELCTEAGGYGSLCYRTPLQQLEMESNPRKVFYTLFGQGDSSEERRQIVRTTGSLLDYVRDATASLNREIDAGDRAIVSDYLESVREIERRVQKLRAGDGNSIELPDAPLGAPDDFTELIDVQFELVALSWQTNQTRIATFRMANEVSMRVYHWLDINEAFHPLSHHGEDPEKNSATAEGAGVPHRAHGEIRAAAARHQGWREHAARECRHPVRQQHGEQRSARCGSGAFCSPRTRRGHDQGQPAPGLSAGHSPRQPAGHAAAACGRAGRKVFRQHRRICRGVMVMNRTSVRAAVVLAAAMLGNALAGATDDIGPDGSTPLQRAAFQGDVAAVKRLLAAHADVRQANVYGVSPLALAAETGNADIIKLLLTAGADVESPSGEGQTALMSVARTGNIDAAKLLIKRGANLNAAEQFGGQTALMWAAARRHPAMVELLAAKGADVNARAIVRNFERHITIEQRYKNMHTGGLTPLLYAVRENCKACVEALLRHKVNIVLPDPDGIAPLTLAMMNGNWDIAKRLLEAGADVNQWDIYGQAPLHVAIENTYVSKRSGVANLGTDKTPNDTDGRELVRLLVEKGADPNHQMFFRAPKETGQVSASSRGTTPFHRACASNDIEIIEYLLAHGADIHLTTAHNETPIMLAINGRAREEEVLATLRVLRDAGADVNVVMKIMYITRNHGGSALHHATKKGFRKVMAELVAYGENPDIKDEDGLTALDNAMSRGWLTFLTTRPPPRMDLAKVLRDLGAKVELSKVPDWPGEFPP
ncbi:MAG: DUF1552 domain-containing protein, partial [Steroidobacteraceae bacterium]